MAAARGVVVARPLEVGGHQDDGIKAVQLALCFAELYSGNLAVTYHSLVGSRGSVSKASSLIGYSPNFR